MGVHFVQPAESASDSEGEGERRAAEPAHFRCRESPEGTRIEQVKVGGGEGERSRKNETGRMRGRREGGGGLEKG